jgi:hypothetical protein
MAGDGNCIGRRELLAKKKAWEWVTKRVSTKTTLINKFYADKDNYDKLWVLITDLANTLDIPTFNSTNLHVMIHENNVDVLILGQLEPCQLSPRSKHYALKYHWFHEELKPRNIITLTKIPTEDKLSDIITKGLDSAPFSRLQKKLMGW